MSSWFSWTTKIAFTVKNSKIWEKWQQLSKHLTFAQLLCCSFSLSLMWIIQTYFFLSYIFASNLLTNDLYLFSVVLFWKLVWNERKLWRSSSRVSALLCFWRWNYFSLDSLWNYSAFYLSAVKRCFDQEKKCQHWILNFLSCNNEYSSKLNDIEFPLLFVDMELVFQRQNRKPCTISVCYDNIKIVIETLCKIKALQLWFSI